MRCLYIRRRRDILDLVLFEQYCIQRSVIGITILSFIGDMYVEGEYHCLSAELANRLSNIGSIEWQANLIWYDVSKRLHIYGYQYRYIPSFIHQNILVFRKKN